MMVRQGRVLVGCRWMWKAPCFHRLYNGDVCADGAQQRLRNVPTFICRRSYRPRQEKDQDCGQNIKGAHEELGVLIFSGFYGSSRLPFLRLYSLEASLLLSGKRRSLLVANVR